MVRVVPALKRTTRCEKSVKIRKIRQQTRRICTKDLRVYLSFGPAWKVRVHVGPANMTVDCILVDYLAQSTVFFLAPSELAVTSVVTRLVPRETGKRCA